jgi:hypothetical protein
MIKMLKINTGGHPSMTFSIFKTEKNNRAWKRVSATTRKALLSLKPSMPFLRLKGGAMKAAKKEFEQTLKGLVSFGEILIDLSTSELPSKEGYFHLSNVYGVLIEDIEDKYQSMKST